MEDDGLIMNFAMPDGNAKTAVKPAPYIAGVSWRERRAMKLKQQGRDYKPSSGVNAIDVPKRVSRERKTDSHKPERRGKENHGDKPRSKSSSDKLPQKRGNVEESAESKRLRYTETTGEKGGINNTYVSSLFTAQTVGATLEETTSDSVVHQPSNAPLRDDSTFLGLGLNEKLANHLTTSMKYSAPTKVQRAVICRMNDTHQDFFVKAQTGSGKTLAFVLPIIHRLMLEPQQITRLSGLFAVILTPTRELAVQIHSVLETILRCHHHLVPGVVVGGEKKKSEKARIRKGVNILVATPGRLADHLENTTSLDVSQVRWLILDEGDRLVELGFQETITKITDHLTQHSRVSASQKWEQLPSRRVNVLCSATMPDDVKQFGSTILEKPEMISIDRASEINATAPDQLVLKVLTVPPKLRLVTLAACLKNVKITSTEVSRSIVFLSCANSVDYHFDVFAHGGTTTKLKSDDEEDDDEEEEGKEKASKSSEVVSSTAPQINENSVVFRLHGSLSQQLRSATIQAFVSNAEQNSNKNFILLCTDVASRGLDMPNISSVVEYDPPFTVDDHLHRIGRSARLGKEGEATIFLLPGEEEGYVEGKLRVVHPKEGSLRIVNYENVLQKAFSQESSEKTIRKDPKAKAGKWDIHATTWHLEVERWLLEDSAALEKASNAFISHVRAYATHIGLERMYFNVKTLHLGHLAKAFGLRETPKKLGSKTGDHEGKKKEDPRKKMLRLARLAEKSKASEFNY